MDGQTALRGSGAVSVAVTLSAILLATLLSPSFTWTGNALSNLGVVTTDAGTSATVLLFNGGLIAGGVLGLAFAAALARSDPTLPGRTTSALYGLTATAMALIGAFPQSHSLHVTVALGFFLASAVTMVTDGLLSVRRGWWRRGVAGLGLGTASVVGWVVWAGTGPVERPGLAMPELAGALALAAWTLYASAGLIWGMWTDSTTGELA